MPRFVVLTHDHPDWHWDLMLESDGRLRTWRLDADPASTAVGRATPLPDHRLLYLTYEGPVSNQRGTVARWDQGDYTLQQESRVNLVVTLYGKQLRGDMHLVTAEDQSISYRYVPAAEGESG